MEKRLPLTLLIIGLGLLGLQIYLQPHKAQNFLNKKYFISKADLAEDENTQDDSQEITSGTEIKHSNVNTQKNFQPAQSDIKIAETTTPAANIPAAPVNLQELAKQTDADNKNKEGEEKKKKKKKKKVVSAEPTKNSNPQKTADSNLNNNADNFSNPAANSTYANKSANLQDPSAVPAQAGPVQSDNRNYEYWKSLLLEEPNMTQTQKFIAAHKTKQVNDEVYFQVATQMYADKRQNMKTLALLLYGSYTSLKSFEALVQITDSEVNTTTNYQTASKYLDNYSSLSDTTNLVVLSEALKASKTSSSLHTEAAKLSEQAAKNYVQLQTSSNTSMNTSSNTSLVNSLSTASAQKYFTAILSSLQLLVQTSTDMSEKLAASQSYANIQSTLSTQNISSLQINP